jgi:hypothetical protein
VTDRVSASRERFEASLEELRGAVESELGWAPRAARWVTPLVAVAAGLALGMAVRRALPRLRRRRRLPR